MIDDCNGCRSRIGREAVRAYPSVLTADGLRIDRIAREWLSVPFMHQGRDRRGIDCVGLVVVAAQAAGYPLDDFTDYARSPHDGKLEAVLAATFGPPVSGLQPGCVVAMAFPRITRHVGILGEYVHGGLSLIHTWNKAGKVIEHRLDEKWLGLIRSAYRLEAAL